MTVPEEIVKAKQRLVKAKQRLCLGCLECCRRLLFPVKVPPMLGKSDDEATRAMIEFYTAHGCEARGQLSAAGVAYVTVIAPVPCPHLTAGGCDIYADRPDVCRRYDGRLDPVLKDVCRWKEL